MSLRVVHITSAHPASDMRIFRKMAASQAARGWEVHAVAIDFCTGQSRMEEHYGVRIHILPGLRMVSRLRRASIGAARVAWTAYKLRPNIVQAHDPELIPFLVPLRLLGIHTIFDAHEDFLAQNKNKVWTRGFKRYPILAYAGILRCLARRFCWLILAATDGVASAYPEKKTETVRNYPIDGELGSVSPAAISQRPRSLAYIGGISSERGIFEIVEAAGRCEALECLEIAGRFETQELEAQVRALPGWRKVRFHGYADRVELTAILGRVRGGLVTLMATPNHLHSIPVKLLEYFNAGLPVIASDFPYWRELVADQETGLLVDPADPEQIASAMTLLMIDDELTRLAKGVEAGPKGTLHWSAEAERMNTLIEERLFAGGSSV